MVAAARGAEWRMAALAVFGLQLVLNLAWSPLFFGGHQVVAALALLVVLDIAVIGTIVLFRLVRPVAALLLVPYLLWVLFATVLTWQFHEANPRADGENVSGAAVRVKI
jgi:tryptophan-rich sensory protein